MDYNGPQTDHNGPQLTVANCNDRDDDVKVKQKRRLNLFLVLSPLTVSHHLPVSFDFAVVDTSVHSFYP